MLSFDKAIYLSFLLKSILSARKFFFSIQRVYDLSDFTW